MSTYDSTKFYWLMLNEDFFDEDALDWLEEQPNGKEYSLFYLKLCLKSLRTNGMLIRQVGNLLVPYDSVKLGELTKTNPDTVVVAMQLLVKIGLVRVLDNGAFYLSQVENMIGSKSKGAFKKQQQRLGLKNRLELEGGQMSAKCLPNDVGGQMSAKCPPDIDIEKDIDKESTLKSTKESELSLPTSFDESPNLYKSKNSTKVFVAPSLDEIIAYATQWGHPEIAEKFYNYYSVGNWKDRDGRKIKNWKQKMQTWFDKERTNNSQQVAVQSSSQVDFKDLMMEYSRLTTNQERYDWFWKHKDIEFKSSYDKSEFITTYSLLVNKMAKELTKEEQIKWYEDCRKFYN